MAFFGLFNKKEENSNTIPLSSTTNVPESSEENIANEAPLAETTTQENNHLTVSYATGWPIDVIYGYMHKNYEQKGYDDALLNNNIAFRDMNMKIIRNKILMIFHEINLNYDAMKEDFVTKIENCNAVGLLTTVAELEKQLSIVNAHKKELAKLEDDFCNNTNEASVPLMSYECGFLRGISAIAMAGPSSARNQQVPLASKANTISMAV